MATKTTTRARSSKLPSPRKGHVHERTAFIGLDVHSRQTEVCLLDDAGTVIGRDRIGSSEASFRHYFRGCKPLPIALEVGRTSFWVSRLLKQLGHDVVVASARHVRLIAENRHKSDRVDAEFLVRLLRVDRALLHPVTHRRIDAQLIRSMLKARASAIEQRTSAICTVRGLLAGYGIKVTCSDTEKFPAAVNEARIPKAIRAVVAPNLEMISAASRAIEAHDAQVAELATSEEAKRLQEIPGVGPVVAVAFIASVDDPARFSSSKDVGAWLGLVPTLQQSGDRERRGRITKEGDRMMRTLLVQAAHAHRASKKDTELKRWAAAIEERAGAKKAVIALARKLGVLMHHLWMSHDDYRPNPNA